MSDSVPVSTPCTFPNDKFSFPKDSESFLPEMSTAERLIHTKSIYLVIGYGNRTFRRVPGITVACKGPQHPNLLLPEVLRVTENSTHILQSPLLLCTNFSYSIQKTAGLALCQPLISTPAMSLYVATCSSASWGEQ